MQLFKRIVFVFAYLQLGGFVLAQLVYFILKHHSTGWLYALGIVIFPGLILFNLLFAPNLILFVVYVVKARLRKIPISIHLGVVMAALLVLDIIYRDFGTPWALSFL